MISRRSSHNRVINRRAGQTLAIAIMVMFIVALVAAVFIGLVARNLFRSERFSNVDAVTQFAEAGVRYADKMLISSEDGADWRPTADNEGVTDPGNIAKGIEPTPDISNYPGTTQPAWQYKRDKFPDFRWTRPYWPYELPKGTAAGQGFAGPTGGYTTFKTGQGRFLLRVSYTPNISDPLSKYIRIDSIGRMGLGMERDPVTGEVDPTTLKPHGNSSLRREITAYKPIGVTDYLRFVTNKDGRNAAFPLGCPGFKMQFGRSRLEGSSGNQTGSKYGVRGAPIRVNGNLLWYGDGSDGVQIYLRGVRDQSGRLVPVDRVEVAGEVKFADSAGVTLRRTDVSGSIIDTTPLVESDDTPPNNASWTGGGFYRDSYPQGGEPTRRVKRLEPPLVDQADPTNTTTRYRLLTLNSGERIKVGGRWVNLGEYGWGRGIYIGNSGDVQSDSQTISGLLTMRSLWLKPGSTGDGSDWNGPYYSPPGAIIELHPGVKDKVDPYISITRADSGFTTWYDAWGQPRPEWGHTIMMPYPNPSGDPNVNGRWVKHPVTGATKHIDGNGVIYAEGNVRIRGMLPPGMQLTVVSGQNIYIEGNLLKYRDPNWSSGDNDPYRGADETCGLALLAKQYVVVNTTQFFAPRANLSDEDMADSDNDGTRDSVLVAAMPGSTARYHFDFGPWESDSASDAPNKWLLALRHTGQMGATYMNARLNYGYAGTEYSGLLGLNTNWQGRPVAPGLQWYTWGLGDPHYIFPGWSVRGPGWGIDAAFASETFPLDPPTGDPDDPGMNANLVHSIGVPNILELALDQTFTRKNYLLGGLAIQPFDVRIEAVIYAQDGSFFVIPGPWFNPNPSDIPGRERPGGVADRFPYYGQPLDTRIIIDGAIAENVPAAIGDVEEWMRKWGKIPQKYGSSSDDTAHPGEGLTVLYDDHAGWPVAGSGSSVQPIRTDAYGRTLPFAPRLPVSGSLIYFGDVM